jgi:hypothetical protein
MLNRYGLVDIDKILKEQGEEQPAGADPQAGAAPPPPPPPPEEEDPNEKIEKTKADSNESDLADFRKKHSDMIYSVVKQSGGDRYNRDLTMRGLRAKFENSGVDKPFIAVFDRATTGLDGTKHLGFIASLHHEGKLSGNKIVFQSPGDASSFAEVAQELRDDLTFETDERDRTVVKFSTGAPQPEAAPPAPGV